MCLQDLQSAELTFTNTLIGIGICDSFNIYTCMYIKFIHFFVINNICKAQVQGYVKYDI